MRLRGLGEGAFQRAMFPVDPETGRVKPRPRVLDDAASVDAFFAGGGA